MIGWTGPAPWEFEFPFPGSLTSTFLVEQIVFLKRRKNALDAWSCFAEREFFIDNLMVRIHIIIALIRWTGLAPWGV